MPKLLIDISDYDYERLLFYPVGSPFTVDKDALVKTLQRGVLIPDNATNGDVIKIMFPEMLVEEYSRRDMCIDFDGRSHLINKNWWNSPYKEKYES